MQETDIEVLRGEVRLWRDRWQAHESAIREITKAYFEAGLGPTPTNPAAVAVTFRRYVATLREKCPIGEGRERLQVDSLTVILNSR